MIFITFFVEDTDRKHYTVEEYKKITNYENTKKILKKMKLELPEVPDINDISKFSIKRDEKILEKIIKHKDDLIRNFQRETNTFLDPEKQIKHEEMEKEWDLER